MNSKKIFEYFIITFVTLFAYSVGKKVNENLIEHVILNESEKIGFKI